MRSRQRGATALGMLCIVAVLGFGIYGVIRLVPVFMEYMSVVRALETTAKEFSGDLVTVDKLRTGLIRRWTVEDIQSVQPRDIEIKKVGKSGFTMRAWYRAEAPFVSNVSFVVDFDKTVDVKSQ